MIIGVVVVVDVVVDGGFDVNLDLNMVTTVDEVAVNGGDHVQVQVQVKVDVQVHVNVNDAISRSRRTPFSWQGTGFGLQEEHLQTNVLPEACSL